MTKYGVFSGTFDPFTCAHYEIVKQLIETNVVDKVIVMPTIVNYYRHDKVPPLFSNAERLALIRKWFDGYAETGRVEICDYEYKLAEEAETVSKTCEYSIDLADRRYLHMLEDLRKRMPSEDVEFYSVIGADSWNSLESWYCWRQLFSLSKFIVVGRAGFKLKTLDYPAITLELKPDFRSVSASEIRKKLIGTTSSDRHDAMTTYLNFITNLLSKGNHLQ